jgi:hypothetical protein
MFELRLFVQRRRKMLARLGAMVTLGVGGLLAIMPLPMGASEAPGSDNRPRLSDPMRLLLSPAPLSSERFLAYYAIAYR